MLYKYRSVQEFHYIEDIIKNNRLYAARYTEFNDRNEGHFYYNKYEYSEETIHAINSSKQSNRILSLSRKSNEELMWGLYADGHRGIVIGVEVDSCFYHITPIEYTHDLISISEYRNGPIEELVKKVLMQKNSRWCFEEEVRVFSRNGDKYISVSIKEIILGSRISKENIEKIKALVSEVNPSIRVKNFEE